jgi:hypothetical protein
MPGRIAKLGDRLRKVNPSDPADLRALSDYRSEFLPIVQNISEPIANLARAISSFAAQSARIKNAGTIIEKMVREKMRLDRMQDIAGLRVVLLEGQPSEQRMMQAEIATSLNAMDIWTKPATVVDRIAQPTCGYRALHVIGAVNNKKVEIQIRTRLQHMWAQVQERMGDLWGRQVRYPGGAPNEGASAPIDGVICSAADLLDRWLWLSDRICEAESGKDVDLNFSEDELHLFARTLPDTDAAAVTPETFQPDRWALVVYQRTDPAYVRSWDWVDGDVLAETWKRQQEKYRGQDVIEIVLLRSNSYKSAVATHARYLESNLLHEVSAV